MLKRFLVTVPLCALEQPGKPDHRCGICVQVVAQLPNLQNLTLKGCPLAESQGYPGKVKEQLPHLHILDSHRLLMSGKPSKQPAKAGHSAADVSLPGKASRHPSAAGDTAIDVAVSTGTKVVAQAKLAHSSEHFDSSDKQLAGPQMHEQALKRRHIESAHAASEKAAGRSSHTRKEPGKKMKMTEPDDGYAVEAMPPAHAEMTTEPKMMTSKAKARRKQATEASLPASGAYGKMPKAELGNVEDLQVLEATHASRIPHGSGAEPAGRVITDTKTKLRAETESSRQQKAASTAPKQKVAKQPSLKAKQRANGSHASAAFATGKKVMPSTR